MPRQGCQGPWLPRRASSSTDPIAHEVVLAMLRGAVSWSHRRARRRADVAAAGRDRRRDRPRGRDVRRCAAPRGPDAGESGMSRNNGAVKSKRQQTIIGLVSRERLGSPGGDPRAARLPRASTPPSPRSAATSRSSVWPACTTRTACATSCRRRGERPTAPMALLRHLLDEFALSFVASGAGPDRPNAARRGGGPRRGHRPCRASRTSPARSPATTRS